MTPFRKTSGDKATPLNLLKTEITDQKWNHISIIFRKLTEPCTSFFQRELKLSMTPNFYFFFQGVLIWTLLKFIFTMRNFSYVCHVGKNVWICVYTIN